jgi:hypothetical protein
MIFSQIIAENLVQRSRSSLDPHELYELHEQHELHEQPELHEQSDMNNVGTLFIRESS